MGVIRNVYSVIVNGTDVTSRFNPLSTEISVERAAGKAADSATISVSNPDGQVVMPSKGDPITIHLAGIWVFDGFVTEVRGSYSKGNGRRLSITASSVNQEGKAKEPSLRHKDDASFSDVAKEFGQKAGINVEVIGDIAQIQRAYWIQQNESFVSWGNRLAREIGATFKVIGDRAFFATRNEGLSVSGQALTPIEATVGVNLISADLSPFVGRPRFKKVMVSYFDEAKGEKVEEEIDTGIGGVEAALRTVISAADKDQAKKKAESLGKESDREKGQGDVTIIGDARVEPEAICTVSGVMPGIDGSYRIDSVSHKVAKNGGFTTSMTLRQPQDGAGVDSRGGGGSSASLPSTAPVPTPRPS